MERYFKFDKINTWLDWRFYLTEKEIEEAEPNTKYITLDGMSGTLDLTESLSGEVTYQDRKLSATFWSDNGTHKERATLLRSIVAMLHGKKIKIIEPDDPAHYFYGRVTVKSTENILPYAEFKIEAICEPWRYAIDESERYIEVNNDTVGLIINNQGVKTLCPELSVTGSVVITNGDIVTELTDGDYKITSLKLTRGVNNIPVSGQGSVTITYREADL